MPLFPDKITNILSAVQNKNVDDIMARRPMIPFLGTTYTRLQLEAWLNKRIVILAAAQLKTEAEITTLRTTLFNLLSNADKNIINTIASKRSANIAAASSALAYDRMVEIVIYDSIRTA